MGVSPWQNPEIWDVVQIGGEGGSISPGIVKISAAKRHNEWDVKRGKGAKGAQYTYNGYEPARFTMTFTFWNDPAVNDPNGPDHYNDWIAFIAQLNYDPTKSTVQAVDIYHPSLDDIGISAVIIEDIGQWEETEPTKYEAVIACIEYAPAPATNASASPAGAAVSNETVHTDPRKSSNVPPTAQQLLQQLETQAQSPT